MLISAIRDINNIIDHFDTTNGHIDNTNDNTNGGGCERLLISIANCLVYMLWLCMICWGFVSYALVGALSFRFNWSFV